VATIGCFDWPLGSLTLKLKINGFGSRTNEREIGSIPFIDLFFVLADHHNHFG
jgi:hypothetical protein